MGVRWSAGVAGRRAWPHRPPRQRNGPRAGRNPRIPRLYEHATDRYLVMNTMEGIVMTKIGIYNSSHMVAFIEAEPKTAWSAAVSYVKTLAHADGVEGDARFYFTKNRICFQRGIYRALPIFSNR